MLVSMLGANVHSGGIIDGHIHLRQSIADALMTPIGSRVMRPAYGSRLFSLIDKPLNVDMRSEVIAAVIETLINCVPQVTPKQVIPEKLGKGFILFRLLAYDVETGEEIDFKGMEVAA